MPNTREKLIELLINSPQLDVLDWAGGWDEVADYLIANGVVISNLETTLATDNNVGDKILCQNCTHHSTEACTPGRVWCKHLRRYMKPSGYCSYGKPKQNKQQTITEETMIALQKLGEQSHENSRDTTV